MIKIIFYAMITAAIISSISCRQPIRKWDHLYIQNNTQRSLYVKLQFDNPDTTLVNHANTTEYNAELLPAQLEEFVTPATFEETMTEFNPSGMLTLFCLDNDTIAKYSYQVAVEQNLYWKRIVRNVSEMKNSGWKITITE